MKKIIFIFIDGFGIGNKNRYNPFYRVQSPIFSFFKNDFKDKNKLIINKGYLYSINTQMGLKGTPQSATGQTALFTGCNTGQILKKHVCGFPNKELRKLLVKDNLLLSSQKKGYKSIFFNCYPTYAEELSQGQLSINNKGEIKIKNNTHIVSSLLKKISVTTTIALSLKQYFFNIMDLKDEKTIYQEFTNTILHRKNKDIPVFSPKKAGYILSQSIKDYDFVLYEYFQTDVAAHKQDMKRVCEIARDLDLFIDTLLLNVNLKDTTVIITSDHGNFEDLSIKRHTNNPVPLFIFTKEKIKANIYNIDEIFHIVKNML